MTRRREPKTMRAKVAMVRRTYAKPTERVSHWNGDCVVANVPGHQAHAAIACEGLAAGHEYRAGELFLEGDVISAFFRLKQAMQFLRFAEKDAAEAKRYARDGFGSLKFEVRR